MPDGISSLLCCCSMSPIPLFLTIFGGIKSIEGITTGIRPKKQKCTANLTDVKTPHHSTYTIHIYTIVRDSFIQCQIFQFKF